MADESHTFASTRTRLEEIVTQVRKKDTSLEKSLDLLEEGVRLANACTELIDQQDWGVAPPAAAAARPGAVAGMDVSGVTDDPGAAPASAAASVTGEDAASRADAAQAEGDGEDAGIIASVEISPDQDTIADELLDGAPAGGVSGGTDESAHSDGGELADGEGAGSSFGDEDDIAEMEWGTAEDSDDSDAAQ